MRSDQSLHPRREKRLAVVVSGLSSDAHTWNLVYLQLVLEELGHDVTNMGACVPDQELVSHCRTARPDLIVLGSVNGHGFTDSMRVIAMLRNAPELIATPAVIGGKLDTVGGDPAMPSQLIAAGFDAVYFEDAVSPSATSGSAALSAFRSFVAFVAGAADAPGIARLSAIAAASSPVGA